MFDFSFKQKLNPAADAVADAEAWARKRSADLDEPRLVWRFGAAVQVLPESVEPLPGAVLVGRYVRGEKLP